MTATVPKEAEVSRESSTCSRVNDAGDSCGKPLDTAGYPLWCKACRASHRKAYNATVKEMSEGRGFAAGVTATKALVASEFDRFRGAMFSGRDAAGMVRACKGPFLPS